MPGCHVTHHGHELVSSHLTSIVHLSKTERHNTQQFRASSTGTVGTSLQMPKRDSMIQHIYYLPYFVLTVSPNGFHSVTSHTGP